MVEVHTPRRSREMKLGVESILTFSGIVVNAALAFVITWMIARGLGAGATGAFFLFTALFMIATSVISMGADTGLVRSLSHARAIDASSQLRPTVRTAISPVIAVGAPISALLFVLSGPIAGWLAPGSDATGTVRLLSLALLPAALTAVLLAGSRGLGRIRTYTLVQNLFIPICRLALVAIAIWQLGTTSSVVWAWGTPLFIAAGIAALTLTLQLRAETSGTGGISSLEAKELKRRFWRFSLPRGGAVILERALDWADVLLVIMLLGARAGGIYGVVTRIVQAGNMLESALRIVLGPRLSAAVARDDRDAAARMYSQVTQLLILGSWPFYLAVALYSDVILGIFGTEFTRGFWALVALATAMAVKNTAGALQTVLLMTGRSTWQLRNKAIQLAVLLALTPLLVLACGLTGAAIAFAVSVIVDTLLASFQVHRALGFSVPVRAIMRAAVIPAAVVIGGSLVARALTAGSGTFAELAGLGAVLLVYAAAVLGAHRRGVIDVG